MIVTYARLAQAYFSEIVKLQKNRPRADVHDVSAFNNVNNQIQGLSFATPVQIGNFQSVKQGHQQLFIDARKGVIRFSNEMNLFEQSIRHTQAVLEHVQNPASMQ